MLYLVAFRATLYTSVHHLYVPQPGYFLSSCRLGLALPHTSSFLIGSAPYTHHQPTSGSYCHQHWEGGGCGWWWRIENHAGGTRVLGSELVKRWKSHQCTDRNHSGVEWMANIPVGASQSEHGDALATQHCSVTCWCVQSWSLEMSERAFWK